MTSPRPITILAALLCGVVIALGLMVRSGQHAPAVQAGRVALEKPADREAAWRVLTTPRTGKDTIPASRHLDAIHAALMEAPPSLLTDARQHLEPHHLWTWTMTPRSLVLRELRGRARDDEGFQAVMRMLISAPQDLAPDDIAPMFQSLLDDSDPMIQAEGLDLALRWSGILRWEELSNLLVAQPSNPGLQRRWLLARAAAGAPVPLPATPGDDAGIVEAGILLARTDSTAYVRSVQALVEHWSHGDRDQPAFAAALRPIDTDATRTLARWLLKRGDSIAGHVLQADSPVLEQAASRSILVDPREPPWRRRLAAWRLDAVPIDLLLTLLEAQPEAPLGGSCERALLAEHCLPVREATDMAGTWIRSFNDADKRAGALLAALTGTHQDLLRKAYEVEDQGNVRTVQELALWCMGASPGGVRPEERAWQNLHGLEDDVNPDILLCCLLAGHEYFPVHVTTLPPDPTGSSIRWRTWLIERFFPAWQEATGRPVSGSRRTLQLHFDRLDVLRILGVPGTNGN